jgi:hypothetical protein
MTEEFRAADHRLDALLVSFVTNPMFRHRTAE